MKHLAALLRTARAMLACLLAVYCAGAGAASTSVDYTDTWWNRDESGWGLQFVQQSDVMFATLYVEDAQTNPIWYTAALRMSAGAWRGDLYLTRGPWFGGPFNPGAVVNRRVGDFAATFSSSDRATITYSVDGVPVTKAIERYTLATESLTGSYTLWARLATASCTGVPPTMAVPATGTIAQGLSSLQMTLSLTVAGSPMVCNYAGNYAQSGRYGSSDGTFTCAGASDAGTYQLREIVVTADVFAGRISMRSSDGCTVSGPLGGYRD
jgi:hypothetical protein